ncbi:UNVERIFIED_CONTAM: hypothetical protein RMT77_010814 [Armadillidium vulgare]
MWWKLVVFACLLGAALSFPQHIIQPPAEVLEYGVDAQGCTVGPSGKVCPTGPVQFSHGATGVAKEVPFVPNVQQSQHQFSHSNQFTGLVGASGVIGPSGLVGPAGPVAFG